MRKQLVFSLFLSVGFSLPFLGQETLIYGRVVEIITNKPIEGVEVFLANTKFIQVTDIDGGFLIKDSKLPLGEETLLLRKAGYETKSYPIVIYQGKTLDLAFIFLRKDFQSDIQDLGFASLTDQDFEQEEVSYSSISSLLTASKEVFLQATAFDFSAALFRPRGYNSSQSLLLINGIAMNKFYDARPLWSNWGGLSDRMKEQVFTLGLSANEYDFGGLSGTSSIQMRASGYRKGGSASYSLADANYMYRVLIGYNTGVLPNDLAISVSASRRSAKQTYTEASLYEAEAFFLSLEKKLHPKHSLNFTSFYTPSKRGRTSANTQEVYDLKNTRYNAYWGIQNGRKRNSRIQYIEEPVFLLNHYWQLNETTSLNTNLAYQFGRRSNTSLGHDRTENPDPTHYQKLPSYFIDTSKTSLSNPADLAKLAFQKYGQIHWDEMYATNKMYDGSARYYLFEDRIDDKQLFANLIFTKQLNKLRFYAVANYRQLRSENFASMVDLLGSDSYLDIDVYRKGDIAQNDLNRPDKLVTTGDKFRYHYRLFAEQYDLFFQTQFKSRKLEHYLAVEAGQTNYQRQGLYKNGGFAEHSYGKSFKLNHSTYAIKAGFTYKISGRHLLDFKPAYYTKAPILRNVFPNPRQTNQRLRKNETEKIQSLEWSYTYRAPIVKARLTAYSTKMTGVSQVTSFYTDGISGLGKNNTSAFVQEILTDIAKQHQGLEFGIETNLTTAIILKAVGSVGNYRYANNPNLYLTSIDFKQEIDLGKASLRKYKLAAGPEQAFQLGVSYKSPSYWWFGITANHFSNAYVNIVPLMRTKNFYTDFRGFKFVDYEEDLVRKMLKQERLPSYILVNTLGGKSWKKGSNIIGIFTSVNNLFNQTFKTGGFEQTRNSNYQNLKQDRYRETPFFGNKYWYGKGTTYYLNLHLGF